MIDDTTAAFSFPAVAGKKVTAAFDGGSDERCFLHIHVYDTEKSRPVAVILRPGKTPSGVEVRAHLRRLVRHIRKSWPRTRILFRGDGHYCREEAMSWCEDNGVDYVFGLTGTTPLSKKVDETADAVRTRRAGSSYGDSLLFYELRQCFCHGSDSALGGPRDSSPRHATRQSSREDVLRRFRLSALSRLARHSGGEGWC
jgi:hypothetical protein